MDGLIYKVQDSITQYLLCEQGELEGWGLAGGGTYSWLLKHGGLGGSQTSYGTAQDSISQCLAKWKLHGFL